MEKKNNVVDLSEIVTNSTLLYLSKRVEELEKAHRKTCEMAARSILYALDMKDHYTYGHSMRVAFYSLTLGREMGLNTSELYNLELASLFHDIGKIGVPDQILLKPERLNEDEYAQMKSHPEKSAEILKGFKDFEEVAKIVRHHHERYDGRGYPSRLKGEDIPLYSRIILISDTFDAMTSSRPYRKGLSYETAFSELDEFSGTQFDPHLVKLFKKAMRKDAKKNEETFSLTIIDDSFKKKAA